MMFLYEAFDITQKIKINKKLCDKSSDESNLSIIE